MNDLGLLPADRVGPRFATRVRIAGDGAFGGRRGIVLRIHHPGAIDVRLEASRDRREICLPFGSSQLEVLS